MTKVSEFYNKVRRRKKGEGAFWRDVQAEKEQFLLLHSLFLPSIRSVCCCRFCGC